MEEQEHEERYWEMAGSATDGLREHWAKHPSGGRGHLLWCRSQVSFSHPCGAHVSHWSHLSCLHSAALSVLACTPLAYIVT